MSDTKQLENKIKEVQSGKKAQDENFPVASFLIKKQLRQVVFAYYEFARTADDIADNNKISSKEKLYQLEELDNNLINSSKTKESLQVAVTLRKLFDKHNINIKHARDLLVAFKQDARQTQYKVWAELIYYCRFSAAPVGRFLLDLHNEGLSTHWSGDRLCAALQIINHLQDIKKDYINLKRIYLPTEFMEKYGVKKEDILKNQATLGMRNLIDEMLDGVDGLIEESKILSKITKNIGLRAEICVITKLAEILAKKLRKKDPIKTNVKLNKIEWIYSFLHGITKAIFTVRMTTQDETKNKNE